MPADAFIQFCPTDGESVYHNVLVEYAFAPLLPLTDIVAVFFQLTGDNGPLAASLLANSLFKTKKRCLPFGKHLFRFKGWKNLAI
jgi:hypothetical protein